MARACIINNIEARVALVPFVMEPTWLCWCSIHKPRMPHVLSCVLVMRLVLNLGCERHRIGLCTFKILISRNYLHILMWALLGYYTLMRLVIVKPKQETGCRSFESTGQMVKFQKSNYAIKNFQTGSLFARGLFIFAIIGQRPASRGPMQSWRAVDKN